MQKPIRVLHCPTMTGGNPQELARAERQIGLESWSVALERGAADYEADEVIAFQEVGPLRMELARWPLLWRAVRDYDIIHFNFGRSLMPHWNGPRAPILKDYHRITRELYGVYARLLELRDLPLLKRAGKGIVVTYQGDDARQGDFCKERFKVTFAKDVEPDYYSTESDRRKRRRIERFAKYADRIYALNPDLLHVLPPQSRFLPYSHIDLEEWRPQSNQSLPPVSNGRPPIVVHAPSNRAIKGTKFLIEAVHRLRREGIEVELELVENQSHSETRRLLARADIFVDQLLAGWYGAAAVESMALGKPVICYLRQEDLCYIPEQMKDGLPLIEASPATIFDVLRRWLTEHRKELPRVGAKGREFVLRWHDPVKVAAQLRGDYEDIVSRRT